MVSPRHWHQVAYLIVDPHYTGKDDLKAILSKGWVGWKLLGCRCTDFSWFTLWLFNVAMENGPFIDDFPIKASIYKGFSMAMVNNQMVSMFEPWILPMF